MNSFSQLFNVVNDSLNQLAITVSSLTRTVRGYSSVSQLVLFNFFGGVYPLRNIDETDADYIPRLTLWLETYLNTIGNQENMLHSDSASRAMREELTNDPLLIGMLALRGSNNTDVFYNNRFPPASSRNVNRQRTFDAVPVSAVLFFACSLLANDESIRATLNLELSQGTPIPVFFQEKLNSARASTCGNIRIVPTVREILPREFIELLGLQNSILDYEYLRTPAGINALFQFFARLNSYGSYVKMTPGKPVQLEAGFQTTETAITFESTDLDVLPRVERRVLATLQGPPNAPAPVTIQQPPTVTDVVPDKAVKLAPGHSYGNALNFVQILDSYLNGRLLSDANNIQIIIGLFGPTGIISGSSFNMATYVVRRIDGSIHNGSVDMPKERPPTQPFSAAAKGEERFDDKATPPKKGKTPYRGSEGKKSSSRRENTQRSEFNVFTQLLSSLLKQKLINVTHFMRLTELGLRMAAA